MATAFIVLGNIFLVAFGNHQSPGMSQGFAVSLSQSTVYAIHYFLNVFFFKIAMLKIY